MIALLDSIDSTHPVILAYILTIKSDTNELSSDLQSATSHLFKADPIEKLNSKSNKRVVISSTLGGRGRKTGLEFRCYHPKEF